MKSNSKNNYKWFKYPGKTNKSAFTLIELLIVIAIIGILFVVLISRVDFATDKAKATGVQTDFRAFQIALETVSKENAGFATFGWDTGDLNGNHIRDSVDTGDANENGIKDSGEIFTGRKKYIENWNDVYTLTNPNPNAVADGQLPNAVKLLEDAINKNLDPKLQIVISDIADADGNYPITMANQARDPWKNEYHGVYITNAEDDNGADRGAIIVYSDGPNGEWGSAHKIEKGLVSISVPGSNKLGKDDMSIVVYYTNANGYGETAITTTGFSNNQQFLSGSNGIVGVVPTPNPNPNPTPDPEPTPDPDEPIVLEAGVYDSSNKLVADWDTFVDDYGLDITKGYSSSTYNTDPTSLYSVLNNNSEFADIVEIVLPDGITQLHDRFFYGCNKLQKIE